MKLVGATIHGFRGIAHSKVRFDDYALVIGPNNAGKSTTLHAILAVYEKDNFKFDLERDVPPKAIDLDGESWVELHFDLTSDESASLKDEYRDDQNRLRLRKYFRSSEHSSKCGALHCVSADGELHEKPFYGAKNVQSGKIGDVIFIPAVSKVDEHTKLTGPSAFRDLVSGIVRDVVASGESFQDLVGSFARFASAVKDHTTQDNRSIAGLEKAINEDLDRWGVRLEVNVEPPDQDSIVKNLTSYSLADSRIDRTGMSADDFGSGFQRQFIFTLIKLRAELKRPKGKANTKDFAPVMTCLLFEEPEAFLHPPQQDELSKYLQQLAREDDHTVICSTHSSQFVSRSAMAIPSLIRARRDERGVVTLHQITLDKWDQIVDANTAINAIAQKYPKAAGKLSSDDLKPEMEAIKHAIWLNPDRSSAFFADLVLIVEGPTEVGLINRLIFEEKVSCTRAGVVVLDAFGKWNMHRFMNLFSALGVSHAVLFDDDSNKDEHAEINQLIVDSASKQFTVAVSTVRGDIEVLLGVPKCPEPRRKPQHLLFCYDQGLVADEKLSSFCGIVNGCLASTAPAA